MREETDVLACLAGKKEGRSERTEECCDVLLLKKCFSLLFVVDGRILSLLFAMRIERDCGE